MIWRFYQEVKETFDIVKINYYGYRKGWGTKLVMQVK